MTYNFPKTRVYIDWDCLRQVLEKNEVSFMLDVLESSWDIFETVEAPPTIEDFLWQAGVDAADIALFSFEYKQCEASRWH